MKHASSKDTIYLYETAVSYHGYESESEEEPHISLVCMSDKIKYTYNTFTIQLFSFKDEIELITECDPVTYLPLLSSAFILANHLPRSLFDQFLRILEVDTKLNQLRKSLKDAQKFDQAKLQLKTNIYV